MPSNKSLYSKKLGQTVAQNAKSSVPSKLHVVSSQHDKNWIVVREGHVRPIKAFTRKDSAVAYAKKSAGIWTMAEVVVHSIDGSVLKRITI